MSHLPLKYIRGKVAHGRLFKSQKIGDLGKRVKIAAYHFSAFFQKSVHDAHELINVMEIMQDAALHKNHIEAVPVFHPVDFQHIPHLKVNMYLRFPGCLKSISPIVL